MSGFYDQSNSDDDNFVADGTGKGLRAQLEKALEEIATLKKAQQKTSAADVLKDRGIDPALADLVPSDADPNEWVEKYGPLLGLQKAEKLEDAPVGEPKIEVPVEEDPAVALEREARADMDEASGAGSTSVYSTDVLERMGKINSEEELMKFFNSNGQV